MVNRISTIISALKSPVSRSGRKKFGRRAPGSVTVLEVEGQLLRVVQTAPRGGGGAVTRIAVGTLAIPAEADRTDPVMVGKAIAKTLSELRLKPSSVVMGVSRAQVVLRTLQLPVVSDVRELASMVHLQVGKDLPFSVDEAVIDFKVNRQITPAASPEPAASAAGAEEAKAEAAVAGPKLEVLIAAIQREVVEFYQRAAETAGLKLAGLGWSSYANARCVEACGLVGADEVAAVISLRPDEMGFDVIAREQLLFSRGTAIKLHTPEPAAEPEAPSATAPDATPAGAAVEAVPPPIPPATYDDLVILDAVRSLHSYGGLEPNHPIVKLVVAGATGRETAVAEALGGRFNLPCQVLDPAGALKLAAAAREHAAGAIAAIGLGLAFYDPEGLPFDFLDPKKPAVQYNTKRTRLLIAAAAAVAALLLVFGVQARLVQQRQAVFNGVKAQLDAAAKQRLTYRRMKLQTSTVQHWTQEGKNWLEHYAYLSAILPPCEEIYITGLTISSQGVIQLSVQARNGTILSKLDKLLRAAGYDVKPLAVMPGADKNGYNFRSRVDLIVPAKMKIELAKAQAPPPRPEDDISLEGKPARKGGGS